MVGVRDGWLVMVGGVGSPPEQTQQSLTFTPQFNYGHTISGEEGRKII